MGFGNSVPLVDRNDDRSARFMCVTSDMRIKSGDSFDAINHEDRDVAALQVPSRHNNAELFSLELGSPLAAYPGGVNKPHKQSVVLDQAIDGVVCRTGDRRHHRAFFPY